MSMAMFEFTEVRLNSPLDNLCTAIGLIQAEILAGDSNLNPERLFAQSRVKHATLETAVAMLVAMMGECEDLRWIDADEVPTGQSPIAVLHREIVERNAFLNGDNGLSEAEFDAYNMETVALADRIAELPAKNADDMLRKLMGWSINGDHELSGIGVADRFFDEARALLASGPVSA